MGMTVLQTTLQRATQTEDELKGSLRQSVFLSMPDSCVCVSVCVCVLEPLSPQPSAVSFMGSSRWSMH